MKEVMVDNWLLDDIVGKANDSGFPDSLKVLLSALVLWDNVHYPLNGMSYWKEVDVANTKWGREIKAIQHALSFFEDTNEAFDAEQRAFFEHNRDLFDLDTTEIVAVGALRYLSLSNSQGFDYLPCAQRRVFIAKYPDVCRNAINRIDTLKPLEKELVEFINDFSKEFGGNCFSIRRPILSEYIRNTTPDDLSYVEYAQHLRDEGPVVQYRNYLDDVENAINHQNLKELVNLRNYSKEIVQHIADIDNDILTADLSILPIPGISLSKSTTISKKLHLTFLEELAKNAINHICDKSDWESKS